MFATFPDLTGYVHPERVQFMPGTLSKRDALHGLGAMLAQHPAVTQPAAFIKAIFDREEVTSTGIGGSVAVPHAQLASVTDYVIAIAINQNGIDFAAKDDQPVKIMVMIAAPSGDRQAYLKVLASVAARLNRPQLIQAMLQAQGAAEVVTAFLAQDRSAQAPNTGR